MGGRYSPEKRLCTVCGSRLAPTDKRAIERIADVRSASQNRLLQLMHASNAALAVPSASKRSHLSAAQCDPAAAGRETLDATSKRIHTINTIAGCGYRIAWEKSGSDEACGKHRERKQDDLVSGAHKQSLTDNVRDVKDQLPHVVVFLGAAAKRRERFVYRFRVGRWLFYAEGPRKLNGYEPV